MIIMYKLNCTHISLVKKPVKNTRKAICFPIVDEKYKEIRGQVVPQHCNTIPNTYGTRKIEKIIFSS